MVHAKFLFRFNNNNMFSDYLKNYFVILEIIHHYHKRQNTKKNFLLFCSYKKREKDDNIKIECTEKKNYRIEKLFIS